MRAFQTRSSSRRSRAACLLLGVSVALSAAALSPAAAAQAFAPTDNTNITVTGSPLFSITTTPITLAPAFVPTVQDYVLRCRSGVNNFVIRLVAQRNRVIHVGPKTGSLISVPVSLGENQAVVITAPGPANPVGPPTQYWIRCLPHNFPRVAVSKTDTSSPGWYLTGNVTPARDGSSGIYAMVLDGRGTPVWYQAAPGGAIDVEQVAPTMLAWSPLLGPGIGTQQLGGFTTYNISTQTYAKVLAPGGYTDPHEFLQFNDGSQLLISTPLANMDLSSLGQDYQAANNTIVDCVVQKFVGSTPSWTWRASDHIGLEETDTNLYGLTSYNGTPVADIYHCNSVDTNGTDALISVRHADAVYDVKTDADGLVQWKLGGTGSTRDAGAKILAISGGSFTNFSAQHDARFVPGGKVSIFDDRSRGFGKVPVSGAARGVEYAIDTTGTGTATTTFEYRSADGLSAPATGSFREQPGEHLVGWGFKANGSGATLVNDAGTVLFNFTFPGGELEYRVLKVPLSSLDANLLRQNSGLPRPATSAISFQPLFGQISSKPAVTSPAAGSIDLFSRGSSNQLLWAHRNGSVWSSDWTSLSGTLASGPAASSWSDRLDVFAMGTDSQLWHRSGDGSTWAPWEALGGILTSGPAAVSWGPNRIDVFVRGTDDQLWHLWYDGVWEHWEPLGGVLTSDPAVASWGSGRLDVFVRGTDNGVWHTWFDGISWNGFELLGGGLLTGPGAAGFGGGRIEVAAAGAGNDVERMEYNAGWLGWQPTGGTASDAPAVVALDANTDEVFIRGTDGQLRYGTVPTAVRGSYPPRTARTSRNDALKL